MIVLDTIELKALEVLREYVCLSRVNRRIYLEDMRYIYEKNIASIMQDAGYIYHHTAIHPGGIRKLNPTSAKVYPYDGRFGIGYAVHRYKEGSDNSHYVDYYIKEDIRNRKSNGRPMGIRRLTE